MEDDNAITQYNTAFQQETITADLTVQVSTNAKQWTIWQPIHWPSVAAASIYNSQ